MAIPRDRHDDYSQSSVSRRLSWLSETTGQSYPYIAGKTIGPELAKGTCENMIGYVGIPLGIAGPFLINGISAKGTFTIPLATTEGALIASFSRGMNLISDSRGCQVLSQENSVQNTLNPAYRFLGDALTKISAVVLHRAEDALKFVNWLQEHMSQILIVANNTSRYARLLEISPLFQGDLIGLAFTYQTGDAMGLNMATKANEAVCRYIQEECPELVSHYFNTLGGDKRFVSDQAKGRYVTASVRIPHSLVKERLRTTPLRMQQFLLACNTLLAQRGATAPNIHVANALTAMFIACGQDPAFVTVSFKNACTHFEVLDNGDLNASLTIPNLIVGVVGGGTKLPIQQECLSMIGCTHDARKLAEITAAVALAGEISVAGAVSAGEFTRAHTVLGRGLNQTKPTESSSEDVSL
ncbi:hydroxymethylglutaryl-CoA reductase [Photorhabdus cinerea]|uniref:Hydroxymethylglutaryl-CoA reductase n=1 Tax=Photorhabdus cinerea TaxID=471575 RepID=A0A7X5QBA9_9GAMM|nr:hydroxymethylglutaryl-CoA reductase [Photorhabdus cinerea]NHB91208.1 hydroxymethylglutaryl-CoA reductase [Photorhabdus cinerea]